MDQHLEELMFGILFQAVFGLLIIGGTYNNERVPAWKKYILIEKGGE
jgi:hypothetical protein